MELKAIVELRHGQGECDLWPAMGGAILRWSVAGQDMLRRTTADAIAAGDPFGFASFPLVPYSNRIGNARFDWEGERYQLRRNFAPEPHALHGVGWQRAWTVAEQRTDSATLRLDHAPDSDWPWPFEAVQRVALTDDELKLTLAVTNRADRAVPLAFGHHPYFDQAGARLRFQAAQIWMAGADMLPTHAVAPSADYDFGREAAVAGRSVDNCYVGLVGPATIEWDERPLRLDIRSAPALSAAVVYVPKGGDAFCFEPVPHLNNALNLPGEQPAMPVVAPGATMETSVHFQAIAR